MDLADKASLAVDTGVSLKKGGEKKRWKKG